ncbi:MAG: hypothetical protein M3N13_06005, partial [Candidatus Eremiobacteraeota bacterium]|nr:hypothetical protein [Candidatus Eremiobacteraeota bacterium]
MHRYSNADKHRIIAIDMPFFTQSAIEVMPNEGIVERIQNGDPPRWGAYSQYEIGRVRYAPPYPPHPHLQG